MQSGGAFEWLTLDSVAVVGRASGTTICELHGDRGAAAKARSLYRPHEGAYALSTFSASSIEAGRPVPLAVRQQSTRSGRLDASERSGDGGDSRGRSAKRGIFGVDDRFQGLYGERFCG
jgi:hypothetical protein